MNKSAIFYLLLISVWSATVTQAQIPFKVGHKTTGTETFVESSIPVGAAHGQPLNVQSNSSSSLDFAETVGQLNISASGAATYTVPISLPPGIDNVQPSLALTYNSQGGNGLAGWGWNLSGLSSITRSAATLFHDGRVGKVNFTNGENGDRFSFDGQKLRLKTGTYGGTGSVYD